MFFEDENQGVYLENIVFPILKEEGKVTRVAINSRDITERKKAEEALRKSEEKFSKAFRSSPDRIAIATLEEGRFIEVNDSFLHITGRTREEVIGHTSIELNFWVNTEDRVRIIRNLKEKGHVFNNEILMRSKSGEIHTLLFSCEPITINGEPCMISVSTDITERKQNEEKLQTILKTAIDGFWIHNLEGRIIEVNDSYCNMTGYTREELLEMSISDIEVIESPEDTRRRIEKIVKEGSDFFETRHRRKDGSTIDVEISVNYLGMSEKQMFVFARDITERKRDEERIQYLNQTLRSIRNVAQLINREKKPEALMQGICNIMVEGQSFNTVWIALLDKSGIPTIYAEAGLGDYFTPFNEMFKKGEIPPCARKAIKREKVVLTEHHPTTCMDCPIRKENDSIEGVAVRLGYKDAIYGIMCASAPSYILSDEELVTLFNQVAADISFALYNIKLEAEHELLEQERLRSAKLESIGTLAGGIAHDFNNLLTGIMGNIGLAKMYLKPSGRDYETLDEAEKAAVRAKDLTQQLLTFARGGMPVKKSVTIAELIKESTRFALRGSSTSPTLSIPDNLWPLEVDEGQISQVIHNIVINADEAMPGGGKLEITASNITLRKTSPLPIPKGKYIRIDIKDTGTGISKEHLQRIFEPYYTTKQKGSGLGLSTAYSIIKNHDGYVTVESTQNKGTTFRIYLPASDKPQKIDKEPVSTKITPKGGKILVMDDEEIIRQMLSNMLKIAGYEAELTVDGGQALDIYNQALETGKPFDAVIMDLTIPGGMGGKEAILKLREIDPQAKVIVSSGYATDPIMADFQDYGFDAVITKPYNISQLENTLHQVLKE